jgi:hypothetical protein
MENDAMFSGAIRYHKTTIDTSLTLISTVLNSGEELLKNTSTDNIWIPDNSTKGYLLWSDIMQQSTETLQALVDQSFDGIESLVASPSKNHPPEVQKKAVAIKKIDSSIIEKENTAATSKPVRRAASKPVTKPVSQPVKKVAHDKKSGEADAVLASTLAKPKSPIIAPVTDKSSVQQPTPLKK